jgi:subtilisin family serine protease
MGNSRSRVALAAAITVALAGFGVQGTAPAYAADQPFSLVSEQASGGVVEVDANGMSTYIITFEEEGLVSYNGGVNGLASTAPNRASGNRKFDAKAPAAQAYGAYLAAQRDLHQASIESEIQRALNVTHSYAVTMNGIAARMTAEEAAAVAKVAGVKSVEVERFYPLDTYRGPAFIGADKIWDGTNVPGGTGTKGQGIVVGVLDGGAASSHPSFANDASCGFSEANPKLIAKDCSSVSAGLCVGPNPEANATFGHGVHTASTAAGNTIDNTVSPAPLLDDGVTMSGVAPCAGVRQYKVCPTDSCGSAAILGGIQNAITDQVDVINFSISGGTSPWNDNDRQFLNAVNADVFVAASAGNTSTTITNPVGNVNHRGPWVMTVAASTHDEKRGPVYSVTGPGTPPPITQNIPLNPGSTTLWGQTVALNDLPLRTFPANIEGCTAGTPIPANYFSGSVAVVRRGTCAFAEKITNAFTAGASMVIVGNNQAGDINMDTTGAPSPNFSVSQAEGDALIDFVAANPGPDLTDVVFIDGFDGTAPAAGAIGSYVPARFTSRQGDVLAGFSLRGPTPTAALQDLSKPDITAPGVDILAATDPASGDYEFMSGTSMSGPHVAGAAALVRAARPNWTVPEVKSAMMMTAKVEGFQEDGTTPWNVDDVGAGRVDLTKAALAGLTMDETYANFLAANPSGGTINVKTLNIPSLRNMTCNGGCSWTRTFKNQLTTSGTWTISATTDSSFGVTATPSTFTIAPGATQTVTFTATPTVTSTVAKFGYVNLTETSNRSPVQHLTVAIKGTAAGLPTISVSPAALSSTQETNTTQTATLTVANTGGGSLNWSLAANANGVIYNQPASSTSGVVSSYSQAQAGGLYGAVDFTLSGSSVVRKVTVYGFDNSNTLLAQPSITWRLYDDASGVPNGNPNTGTGTPIWTYTAAPTAVGVTITDTGQIDLDLDAIGQAQTLPGGTYWLVVTPTYSGNISGGSDPRWNWFYADTQGTNPAKLIGSLFGVSSWTNLGSLVSGGGPDFAFKLEGDAACGASWLSLSPSSGTVGASGSTNVTATFNSTGLSVGTYSAMACIASNDANNPIVKVPVTLTVQAGGGGETCTPIQLLQDTSFEGTDPSTFENSSWPSTDSAVGTPFCSGPACVQSGVPISRTGEWWAWFGGTSSGTSYSASIEQSVVIPAGSTSRYLHFWALRTTAATSATTTLRALVDGTVIASYPKPTANDSAYQHYALELPASVSDGGSHTIKIDFSKSGSGSTGNVHLDDVTIDCSSAAPASNAARSAFSLEAVTAERR